MKEKKRTKENKFGVLVTKRKIKIKKSNKLTTCQNKNKNKREGRTKAIFQTNC
jgi:hypothetical protein